MRFRQLSQLSSLLSFAFALTFIPSAAAKPCELDLRSALLQKAERRELIRQTDPRLANLEGFFEGFCASTCLTNLVLAAFEAKGPRPDQEFAATKYYYFKRILRRAKKVWEQKGLGPELVQAREVMNDELKSWYGEDQILRSYVKDLDDPHVVFMTDEDIKPDPGGVSLIAASFGEEGGHAIIVTDVDLDRKQFTYIEPNYPDRVFTVNYGPALRGVKSTIEFEYHPESRMPYSRGLILDLVRINLSDLSR